jgi:hypothetical protein
MNNILKEISHKTFRSLGWESMGSVVLRIFRQQQFVGQYNLSQAFYLRISFRPVSIQILVVEILTNFVLSIYSS